ncbi:MAG: glutathione S-transferase family protein [Oceanococcus sp.]
MTSSLQLWQFRAAMYPEAARWILDFKGIHHARYSLLPGPHVPKMLKRFGYKATPVLVDQEKIVKGVAKISRHLEQRHPEPTLCPMALAQEIFELQQQFLDAGPAVRRAFFGAFLQNSYAADRFSSGFPERTRRFYRWGFPITRVLMRHDMAINARGVDAGLQITKGLLDLIAQRSAQTGYLVGSSFSLADLTAASLMHVCVLPQEYPVAWPQPYPPALQQWLERWADHPGALWVLEMYEKHRSQTTASQDICA